MVLTALPVFSGWCYKTQSVKDDFGDEIRKDDYYLYDDYIHDDCNKFIN